MKTFVCAVVLSAVSAFGAARPDATITFDTSAPAFKDQRDSRANPVMGWAGTITDIGGKAGKPRVWLFRCRERDLWFHQTPGEPPPSWQEEFDGDANALVVPAYTIATLVFPIGKEAK